MKYTNKIQDAIRFATGVHQGQFRKGKDVPYITHPLTAALILSMAGADETTIVAGILHDTVEDCKPYGSVTRETIAGRFGEKVASLVEGVTEQNKSLSWAERKARALEHIASFSHESALVKSADIISNISEIRADLRESGKAVWSRFNAPKKDLITSYVRVCEALIARWPESPLAGDLREASIQLSRELALDEGDVQYALWTVEYIRYETNRIFSSSPYKSEVEHLCDRMTHALVVYDATRDIKALDLATIPILDSFDAIITATESPGTGLHLLLVTHAADIMYNLQRLRDKVAA